MHRDQAHDRLINAVHLNQRHLAVLLKELEIPHRADVAEQVAQLLLLHTGRNVGEVEGLRGRKDVVEVLGAGLLEAVQRRVGEVLGQARVGLPVLGHLHGHVLGGKDAHLLAPQLAPVINERLILN